MIRSLNYCLSYRIMWYTSYVFYVIILKKLFQFAGNICQSIVRFYLCRSLFLLWTQLESLAGFGAGLEGGLPCLTHLIHHILTSFIPFPIYQNKETKYLSELSCPGNVLEDFHRHTAAAGPDIHNETGCRVKTL